MKVIAAILIVFALAIAVVPQFTDCQSQGRSIALPNGNTIPMRCHWTAQAEIAVAGPLALVGAMIWINKRKETQRMLAVLGIALGIFAILLPTALIGVCASEEMLCNSLMKPTLIFSGIVTSTASLVGFVLSRGGAAVYHAPEGGAA